MFIDKKISQKILFLTLKNEPIVCKVSCVEKMITEKTKFFKKFKLRDIVPQQ